MKASLLAVHDAFYQHTSSRYSRPSLGRVINIMVEKSSGSSNNPNAKYKERMVFQGTPVDEATPVSQDDLKNHTFDKIEYQFF